MKIIDAHNHPRWLGFGIDKHVANMDELGIDVTWLLTWESPPNEHSASNISKMNPMRENLIALEDCVAAAEKYPGRFVPGYCPDPRHPYAIDRLESAIDIYGVRICGEWKYRMLFDDPDNIRMWRYCGEKGLPVTIHLDYPSDKVRDNPRTNYWYGGSMESLERAMRAAPDTIVLGHGPGFWATISGDGKHLTEGYPKGPIKSGGALVRMMREYPNLYADNSAGSGHNALTRDRDFGRDFILEFQDRILYARDMFDNRHREMFESFDLPADVREKIFSKNALKLVPL